MPHLLICDLDGTLVDSFAGIAAAVRGACKAEGIEPQITIDRAIVGPPLDTMLRMVAGPVDPTALGRLRSAYIEFYDTEAYSLARPFQGVAALLTDVTAAGHVVTLATNKRLAPTRRILDACGWAATFAAVEAVDSRPGRSRTKAEMLIDARADVGPRGDSCFYLGDTDADVEAAREAGMPCIRAAWGPGVVIELAAEFLARSPEEVAQLLARA